MREKKGEEVLLPTFFQLFLHTVLVEIKIETHSLSIISLGMNKSPPPHLNFSIHPFLCQKKNYFAAVGYTCYSPNDSRQTFLRQKINSKVRKHCLLPFYIWVQLFMNWVRIRIRKFHVSGINREKEQIF